MESCLLATNIVIFILITRQRPFIKPLLNKMFAGYFAFFTILCCTNIVDGGKQVAFPYKTIILCLPCLAFLVDRVFERISVDKQSYRQLVNLSSGSFRIEMDAYMMSEWTTDDKRGKKKQTLFQRITQGKH